MYVIPLASDYSETAEVAGLYDRNRLRAEYVRRVGAPKAEVYDDFDDMMKTEKPDVLIVAAVDRFHHEYIVRGLEYGCDVITEKPMTINAEGCKAILNAEKQSGKKVTVTFNCRFSPLAEKIKYLLKEEIIGKIWNIDFEWLLDCVHGADYFRRWHRRLENSGGLLVHKATHHFDLVNWWLEQEPVTIYANGSRRFYGPTRVERGKRCSNCIYKNKCEFVFLQSDNEYINGLYYIPEQEDGYFRDSCVFSEEVNIYDNMSVNVKYDNGALLTYSLVAYSPYEGWKIAFTGTEGRMEVCVYTSGERATEPVDYINIYDRRGGTVTFQVPKAEGVHGGEDAGLLEMLFGKKKEDVLMQLAGTKAGINSVMIGACANLSILDGRPHRIDELIY